MFSKLFSDSRAIYEIMLKKLVIAGVTTDDNILRRMRIECWMINKLGICNTYCFSTQKMVTRKRL